MKTKTPLFRFDRLLIAALALLTAPQVQAQTTYLYTNTVGSGTWMTAANWQTNGVTSTTAPSNASTAVVRFTNSGAITVGVNLNQPALGNTVSIGSLLKENTATLTMNNSSGASNGTVRVFGTVSGADTNLITTLGTGALILTNGASTLMDVQLASGGIINVSNSGGRVVLASLIKEDAGETNTITKTGSGTLVISGTNVNTWGGGVVLNAGVLQLNKASALGSASGLGLTINGGSLDNGSGAAVTLSNYAQTWGASFTFIGTTNLNLGAGAVNLTGIRTVTVTANALTVGGAITNTGGITKAGAGTLILNGANTYSGTTTVNAGTLALGNLNALQNSVLDTGTAGTQAVSFTAGGTYNIGGLQGSDDLDNSGNTLSIGASGGNTTYSGALSGAGALIKTGAGTLTLTAVNSYSGGTTINQGAVEITGANRLGNVNGALTINDGKLLVTTAGLSSGRNISLGNANSTIEVASGITYTATNTSVVSGSGRLNKTGSGVLALYGTNTYSGGTVVSAGTLAGDTAGVSGAITNNATVDFVITTNGTYSGAMTGTGALTKSGAATLTTTGINDFSGATTISAGALFVNGTNANSAVAVNSTATIGGTGSVGATTINSGGTMSPGNSPGTQTYSSLVWEGGGNYNWQLHDASGAAGTGYDTFVSTGAFTINATSGNKFNINLWTLSGIGPDTNGSAINFTNTSDYTWTLGSFGSISGFAASAFNINTGATNGASGFANIFSGSFSISTNATQLLLVYTAPVVSSVYTWNTTDGLWSVGGNWTNGSAPTNTSALIFAGASGGFSTNDNTVNNIGSLTFSNTAGSYTLSGNAFTNGANGVVNNSTSAQTINNDITLGAAQAFNAASGNLTFGGAIDNNGNLFTVTGSSNTALNGIVSGNGGLTKSGNGSLTLGGNSSYTGALSANGGTVLVNGTQATTTINVGAGTLLLGAGDVLANGAALTLNGGAVNLGTFSDTISTYNQVAGTITNGSLAATTYNLTGGTMGAGLNGGTVNVGGNVSLSGTITNGASVSITNGTLTYSANDRMGDNSTVTVNGGTLNLATFSDTISTYNQVAGTITNGSLGATTYNLTGGTMGAGLNGGAVSIGGNVTLSGTITNGASVNITNGGTLTLGSANRISDNSTVTVAGGLLDLATFSDTISIYNQVAGTITNGTLVATTYNLGGGTVATNTTLGAGTANVTNGTVTLNGSLAATTLNIGGGTLALGANGRIDNATVVNLSSGALDMGTFIDGVGTFNMTGGSVNGTGANSLTAINGLNLQAGTINANIGNSSVAISNGTTTINGTVGGAVAVSSGTANLNGSLSSSLTASGGTVNLNTNIAGGVTVSGGTVNLAAADLIGNTSTVNVSSGSLNMNGNDSVGAVQLTGGTIAGTGSLNGTNYDVQAGTIAAQLSGSGAMNKTGVGTTTLSGDNSGYTGAVTVRGGSLLAGSDTALGGGTVTMTNGSILATAGRTIANGITIGSPAGFTSNSFTAYWNFGTTNGNANATTTTGTGITFGAVSQGNNNGTTTLLTSTTASSGYTDASGQFNAGAAARTGALNTGASGSAYFEFTLTADSGFQLSLTNLTFGSRGTGTGPTLATLLSSINNYSTNTAALATNALGANSTWALISPTVAASTLTNGSVTFRIYGSAGTGSPGVNTANWRIDDLNLFGYTYFDAPVSGSGTLGINEAGSATFTGAITNNNVATLTAASGGLATFSGAISGLGSVTKTGTGTVILSGSNNYAGGTTLSNGVLRLDSTNAAGTGTIAQADGTSTLEINTTGTVTNSMSIFNVRTLQTVTLSGNKTLNNATYTVDAGTTTTESGVLSGSGGITKEGAGSLVVTASNSFTGATVVNAGTLNLNSSTGSALGASTNVTVAATLLISQSGQVADNAAITLSGGTISRASGVSETFGALSLTDESFLDFGSGTSGNMAFGTYTPSSLLTLNNFFSGNVLSFNSDLTGSIAVGTYDTTSFLSGDGLFQINSISGGFTTSYSGGTFTITAIPEPSTYLAAAGLLGMMLWPSRKRIVRDAKRILGLRAPMRDRLAAKRA